MLLRTYENTFRDSCLILRGLSAWLFQVKFELLIELLQSTSTYSFFFIQFLHWNGLKLLDEQSSQKVSFQLNNSVSAEQFFFFFLGSASKSIWAFFSFGEVVSQYMTCCTWWNFMARDSRFHLTSWPSIKPNDERWLIM